jgi:hypothetical protein
MQEEQDAMQNGLFSVGEISLISDFGTDPNFVWLE